MKGLEEIALGAERSRRAAWAQVYQMRDRVAELEFELAKYRLLKTEGHLSGIEGSTYVTGRCYVDGCDATIAFFAEPLAEFVKPSGIDDEPEGWSGHLNHTEKSAHFGPCPTRRGDRRPSTARAEIKPTVSYETEEADHG